MGDLLLRLETHLTESRDLVEWDLRKVDDELGEGTILVGRVREHVLEDPS
jgi:hypothetical protein